MFFKPETTTLRCSFCALEESPQRHLMAGTKVFICNECVRVASDVFAKKDMGGKVFCAICRDVALPDEYLVFEGQGYLCPKCVRAVLDATDSVPRS